LASVDVDEYGVEASAETAVWVGTIGMRKKNTGDQGGSSFFVLHL
jgi:serine protease inhibitor